MLLSFVSRLISRLIAAITRFLTVLRFHPKEQVVSLKLLVNTDTNKVLFAEADKDFVDILCSFLTLPLGTIARLIQKKSNIEPVTIGCLNSLYQSVENLGLVTNYNSSEDYCRILEINIDDSQPTKYFICSKHEDLGICSYLSIGTKKNYLGIHCPVQFPCQILALDL